MLPLSCCYEIDLANIAEWEFPLYLIHRVTVHEGHRAVFIPERAGEFKLSINLEYQNIGGGGLKKILLVCSWIGSLAKQICLRSCRYYQWE
jgi:hypothetical protein